MEVSVMDVLGTMLNLAKSRDEVTLIYVGDRGYISVYQDKVRPYCYGRWTIGGRNIGIDIIRNIVKHDRGQTFIFAMWEEPAKLPTAIKRIDPGVLSPMEV